MLEFPSTIERTVASSLLHLSYGPVIFSSTRCGSVEKPSSVMKWCDEGSSNLSLRLGASCRSALSSDYSSPKSNDRGLKFNYTRNLLHLVNFKVARKRRSQVVWGSLNFKPTHIVVNPNTDISTYSDISKEDSCLSTGSSTERRIKIRNQIKNEKRSPKGERKNKENSKSISIRRRAEAILEFLSATCSSEVKIREVLGDSPDTSKALRMLLKMEEVKRSGSGGRLDPYIYKIA